MESFNNRMKRLAGELSVFENLLREAGQDTDDIVSREQRKTMKLASNSGGISFLEGSKKGNFEYLQAIKQQRIDESSSTPRQKKLVQAGNEVVGDPYKILEDAHAKMLERVRAHGPAVSKAAKEILSDEADADDFINKWIPKETVKPSPKINTNNKLKEIRQKYQEKRRTERLKRRRLENNQKKIEAGKARSRLATIKSLHAVGDVPQPTVDDILALLDPNHRKGPVITGHKMSGKSMLIGGGLAWLGYSVFANKGIDDQIKRMKGEQEISLIASATGAAVTGATILAAVNMPFDELITKSTIHSDKIFKTNNAAGFLEKMKTPNKFLMGSIGLMAYGAVSGTLNLTADENVFRAPLLSTLMGSAGVLAFAHYAKNNFDMDKALANPFNAIKDFKLGKNSPIIKTIGDIGAKIGNKFSTGTVIPENVPGSRVMNQILKNMPKSHIGKLALFGGGLVGVAQQLGVFDRESDIMLAQIPDEGTGNLLGYNAKMARDSINYRNEKKYRLSQRNSRYQEYQPRGAALV